jgi:phage terminase large subunit
MRVPIANYLKELDVDPLPSQIALVNGINNPKYRFGCAALSRRQGKTYIANIVGQVVALVPGSHVLIMAPNYSLSQISFDLQRNLIKKFGLEVTKDNAKDKVIELANGSTIRIGSVNQVDSCVGRSYDLIIFDEAALTDGMEAFNVALRPTLDKPNSKALFISTPRGKNNWFSTLFDRGFRDDFPEWFSVKATWKDNPRMTESDVAEARRSMSEAEFRQEYEADFSIFEGKIWQVKDTCYKTFDGDFRKADVLAGLDLGFRDPTAMVVVAYSWEHEAFFILDEYLNNEKTTAGHAEEIKRLMDKWRIDYIYIDSANQQQRYDFAQEYDIPTMNAKKSVLDGIGYVASLADNDKIMIDPECRHVLHAFDQYQWDSNANLQKEKPLHNDASHMADAIRYALYSYKTNVGGF